MANGQCRFRSAVHFFKPDEALTASLLQRWISLLPKATRGAANEQLAGKKLLNRGAAVKMLFGMAERNRKSGRPGF